jgi:hypothetical protein
MSRQALPYFNSSRRAAPTKDNITTNVTPIISAAIRIVQNSSHDKSHKTTGTIIAVSVSAMAASSVKAPFQIFTSATTASPTHTSSDIALPASFSHSANLGLGLLIRHRRIVVRERQRSGEIGRGLRRSGQPKILKF